MLALCKLPPRFEHRARTLKVHNAFRSYFGGLGNSEGRKVRALCKIPYKIEHSARTLKAQGAQRSHSGGLGRTILDSADEKRVGARRQQLLEFVSGKVTRFSTFVAFQQQNPKYCCLPSNKFKKLLPSCTGSLFVDMVEDCAP